MHSCTCTPTKTDYYCPVHGGDRVGQPSQRTQLPPETIYLQWHLADVTWCPHKVENNDIRYRRDQWQSPETAPEYDTIMVTIDPELVMGPTSSLPFVLIGYREGPRFFALNGSRPYSWSAVTGWQPVPKPYQPQTSEKE